MCIALVSSLFLSRGISAVAAYGLLSVVWGKLANYLHTVRLVIGDGDDTAAGDDKPHLVLMNQVRPHTVPSYLANSSVYPLQPKRHRLAHIQAGRRE